MILFILLDLCYFPWKFVHHEDLLRDLLNKRIDISFVSSLFYDISNGKSFY